MRKVIFWWLICILGLLGCSPKQPRVVVVTATFEPNPVTAQNSVPSQSLSPVPDNIQNIPTPDPTRIIGNPASAREYVVQPGDTLYGIALANNVSLESLIAENTLENPNVLSPGQVIRLPGQPDRQSPDVKIIPDSRLVRAPGSARFDVIGFVNQQPGYIRTATDVVTRRTAEGGSVDDTLTAAQVVARVSIENSVDARLLLAVLEYRAHWLSQPQIDEDAQQYPLISQEASGTVDRAGLYKQLSWAANELSRGYYTWKYNSVTTLDFDDGQRILYAPDLNAGTVGVQYFLSLHNTVDAWTAQVSENGFYRTYYAYFGDPFADAVEPLVPNDLAQPLMTFPFASGQTWFYTGGPHEGWANGSGWAAVDFAPPDDRTAGMPACYVSEAWATAVAPGVIARSEGGGVILDLDGDGDESTGWTVFYLHIATEGRVAVGTQVQAGDPIGHPSCEGGFSTATHMHIARRYNGEWIPASCPECPADRQSPPFVMSNWMIVGYARQEYQGYMQNGGEQRTALEGRNSSDNRISW